jgi:hypothetical protein
MEGRLAAIFSNPAAKVSMAAGFQTGARDRGGGGHSPAETE